MLCVFNTKLDATPCVYYDGYCGGIIGKTELIFTSAGYIEDLFVGAIDNYNTLLWKVNVRGCENYTLAWELFDSKTNESVLSGTNDKDGEWKIQSDALVPWEIGKPQLYDAVVRLIDGNCEIDRVTRRIGVRKWECQTNKFLLNGTPVFLRANCRSHHFPQHCSSPYDKEYFLWYLGRLQELGFNSVKYLFSNIPDVCLEAADELGMPVLATLDYRPDAVCGVEGALNDAKEAMAAYMRHARNHPSLAVLRLSGELYCYDAFIEFIQGVYDTIRSENPCVLILPSHATAALNYQIDSNSRGLIYDQGFAYNARVQRMLESCTDIMGYYSMGDLTYNCPGKKTWRDVDREAAVYEHVLLAHELGMKASYINMENAALYTNRIPPKYYIETAQQLETKGLTDRARLYYECSARAQRLCRKYSIEETRLSRLHAGYEYLEAFDHFSGTRTYAAGFTDEVGQLKPGDSESNIRQYQNDNVLILDFKDKRERVYYGGGRFQGVWTASVYGGRNLNNAVIRWRIKRGDETLKQGETFIGPVLHGRVTALETFSFVWPKVDRDCEVLLCASLESDDELEPVYNEWEFWLFTKKIPPVVHAFAETGICDRLSNRYPYLTAEKNQKLHVCSSIDEHELSHLCSGGDVLLLGYEPFDAKPVINTLAIGHASFAGDLGVVVHPHPVTNEFPHAGWGSWQFHKLMEPEKAMTVLFDSEPFVNAPFDPLIEIISSDKQVRRQALMFEYTIGEGRLFAFSGTVRTDEPAGEALLDSIFAYICSDKFHPRHSLDAEKLKLCFNKPEKEEFDAVDYNVTSISESYEIEDIDNSLWNSSVTAYPTHHTEYEGKLDKAENDYNAGAGTGGSDSIGGSIKDKSDIRIHAGIITDGDYLYIRLVVPTGILPAKEYHQRHGGTMGSVMDVKFMGSHYIVRDTPEGVFLSAVPFPDKRAFAEIKESDGTSSCYLMIPDTGRDVMQINVQKLVFRLRLI